ncbi:MAG: PocR ligand-binding domain-containing protein [Chloroflexi bacterium]|nr:PocR ligand-binding domain-containing protein [Chloroflexota bacterium]
MPDKLLTTRELVDLLQLDRVTIYKMVKDGEVPALRVGGQWRFSTEAIDAWLKAQRGDTPPEPARREAATDLTSLRLTDLIPIATLQRIQDQFAQLLGVASFITDLEGQPLAPCSRCSRFCRIIHTQPEGMVACQASWRTIARLDETGGAAIHTCHAGIQYASAPVTINGQRVGMVTAGQFLTETGVPETFRAQALATGDRLGVDGEELAQAQGAIEIVTAERAVQITDLLATIANAISGIGYQSYLSRQTLAQIAQITAAAQA